MIRSYPSGFSKRKVKQQKNEQMKHSKESIYKHTVQCDLTDAASVTPANNVEESAQSSNEHITSAISLKSSLNVVADKEIVTSDAEVKVVAADSESPTRKALPIALASSSEGFVKESTNLLCCDNPALWTKVTNEMREYFIENPINQNAHLIGLTGRQMGDKKLS